MDLWHREDRRGEAEVSWPCLGEASLGGGRKRPGGPGAAGPALDSAAFWRVSKTSDRKSYKEGTRQTHKRAPDPKHSGAEVQMESLSLYAFFGTK